MIFYDENFRSKKFAGKKFYRIKIQMNDQQKFIILFIKHNFPAD